MREIFLVHDKLESHWVRQHYLESAGYKVTAFESGDECLHVLTERCPDVILMDVLIDGRTGFEVCAAIRAEHLAKDLPVILASEVYRDEPFLAEAQRVGSQRYLLKPCPLEDLVRTISDVLETRGEEAA